MKKIIPCVLITLALILAGFFLPVFGFAGLALCPLPLCVLGCLEGQKKMSIAELLIEITLFIALSPSMAVYFLIGCAPISAVIYFISRADVKEVKKFSGSESVLICSGASIAFKTILILVFKLFTGKNILFPDSAQIALTLQQLYGNNPDLQKSVLQILVLLPYLMPSLLIIYASVEGFLNYSLCSFTIKKYFPSIKNFPPELPEFKTWRFSSSILSAGVISFIASYFIDTDTWFGGAIFLMNLQIVLNVFMFIHGLAFAFWIMDGFKLKRRTKIFICFILAFPFFWAWLIIMGMSDMALNLRERIKFKSS